MFVENAQFKEGDQVIWTPAVQGKLPQLAKVENVLPGKYGIRTLDDQQFQVVKAENLTPANPAVPTSNGGAQYIAPSAVNEINVANIAPAVHIPESADFYVGQAVMYDAGTFFHGVKNDPVPATIVKIAKQKILIALADGNELWVFPRKLAPIVDTALTVSDSPRLEGEGLGVRVDDEYLDQAEPRPVGLDRSAITGVCTVCGEQYDYVFDHRDWKTSQWRDFVYWAALVNPCPVCKLMQTNTDTEELPIVPEILPDENFIDPPTVNHPDQYDEDDCNAADYGEDPDEIATFTIPLHHELLIEEIDPFDHPAVATRISQLNQRIDDMIAALQVSENRREVSDARAEQFQLQVLELVRKIPAPVQPCLDKVDRDRLEFLCQRHLRKSLEETLAYLRFDDNYARDYPTFEVMCKAIAQRLVDHSLPVIAHECATEVSKTNSLFISLSFGFNTVALFNDRSTDIEHAFAHTRYHHIMHDWRSTAFAYTFDPPVKITMKRDHKLYPKLFTLFVMEDES